MRVYKRRARKTRFQNGKRTPAKNKQGFTMNFYEPQDANDPVVCRAGETYYTWHPKGQPWQYSTERPVFVKQKTEWEEKYEEFQSRVDEVTGEDWIEASDEQSELQIEIEEYQSELQERLDNMPQQLQDSSVLNERIEELQLLLDQLQN